MADDALLTQLATNKRLVIFAATWLAMGTWLAAPAALASDAARDRAALAALPEIHASVAVQAEFYGDGEGALPTSFGKGAFGADNYSVRYAALVLAGKLGSRLDYGLEAGTATCTGGSSLSIMEASLRYRLAPSWRVGLAKGHILRGMALREECIEGLAAEKPLFAATFAPCHPVGAVLEYEGPLAGGMELDAQAALLNGADGTLEKERDANLGLILRLPDAGLSLSGYFNVVDPGLGTDPASFEPLYGDGWRWGAGAGYEAGGAVLRTEYYRGKGFETGAGGVLPPEASALNPDWDAEAHEMAAFYIETGWRVETGREALDSIRPYLRYQYWDKAANDEDLASAFAYLTCGVVLGLGTTNAFLRIDYETQIARPDDRDYSFENIYGGTEAGRFAPEEASRLVVRLQATL